jgi:glycosyl transferase, family 25
MGKKNKIYVISLQDEIKRRQSVASQLKEQGINYVFVDALDLRDDQALHKNQYYSESKSLAILGREMTAGEVGCAVSHRWAYQRAISEGLDYALIIEDDALLAGNLNELFDFVDAHTISWDIIILGYSKLKSSDAINFYRMEPVGRVHSSYLGNKIGRVWRNWTCGTVGYLISKSGAVKLLNSSDKVCVVADSWGYFENALDLKIFHHRPNIVYENFTSFESSIQNDRASLLRKERKYLNSIRVLRGYLRKVLILLRGAS